jgi:hypothetical protein
VVHSEVNHEISTDGRDGGVVHIYLLGSNVFGG